jgi:hypothetical protein
MLVLLKENTPRAESYDNILVLVRYQHVYELLKRAFYFKYTSNYKYIPQSSSTAALCWVLKIWTSMFTHSLFHTTRALTSGAPSCHYSFESFHPYRISKVHEGPDWYSFVATHRFRLLARFVLGKSHFHSIILVFANA